MKIRALIAVLSIAAIGFSACGGKDKLSSEKAITKFHVNNVEYTINPDYTITKHYEKQVENTWETGMPTGPVAPTIEFKGKSIFPDPSTVQTFIDNVIEYTVTAEDGTTQKYRVIATRTMTL